MAQIIPGLTQRVPPLARRTARPDERDTPCLQPLCGVVSCIGESTGGHAYDLVAVTRAVDAMTDTNADAQADSLAQIFSPLGETGATQAIIDLCE